MIKFVTRIFIFASILVLFSYPIDHFVSQNLKKSETVAYGEIAVWEDIFNGNINSDIIIYGSSRAWAHINPQLIQDSLGISCYNLGIDGHNIWLQYLRHKLLLKYNRNPQIIILSVGPFTLGNQEELYNYQQFLPYIFEEDVNEYISRYRGFSYFDFRVPLIRYCGETEAVCKAVMIFFGLGSNSEYRERGYRGIEASWNADFENARNEAKEYVISLYKPSIELLRTFLSECKQKNISVMMVYTPMYMSGQKYIANMNEIITLYENISQEYSIPFIDYSDNEICKHKEYFYNSIHMNIIGSTIFTNIYIGEIRVQSDSNL